MIILALGVALWSAAHFLPSVSPGTREGLIDMVGPKVYRGLFTVDMLIALALIVWGYQRADWVAVYDPPVWGVHANNALMILAIYLFGVGGAKGWVASKIRHPMLLGAATWAVAHLLANGDQASVLLFGGLLLWSIGMIFMINRRVGAWAPPTPAGIKAEVVLIVMTLVIYGAIAFIHGVLLGVWPFPG
ncbi:MAG: NnrU family protein [Pseudomonadota bacterium]